MTIPIYQPYLHPADDPECEQCYSCGRWMPPGEAERCQGADPDLCCNLICGDCRQQCECGLPVCPEHALKVEGATCCANCRQDVEIASQEDAEPLATLAAAGCTSDEARALSREIWRA